MPVPIPGDISGAFPGFTPRRDRFVALGLALAVVGWIALAADLALAASGLQPGSLVAVLSLKADIATLAEMLILTGLGLAILGGLREGFGALNRFFDAVLQRSTAAHPGAQAGSHVGAQAGPYPAAPPPVRPDLRAEPRADARADLRPAPAPEPFVERDEGIAPPRRGAAVRGADHAPAPGRNYQILPDGSVEVDTLLGTRVFASMEEARDFIR